MRNLKYSCVKCGKAVVFVSIITEDDGHVYLLGVCISCHNIVKYDIEKVLKDALEPVVGFPIKEDP